MTDRVQFREDAETLAYLVARGLNPNELARAAFQAEVRRLRARESWSRLRKKGIVLAERAADVVREERDRGHGRHG